MDSEKVASTDQQERSAEETAQGENGMSSTTTTSETIIIVDFEDEDPTNPLNWKKSYKWSVVILAACLSAMIQLATIIAAPVSPQILKDFHSDNTLYRTLIVSIWELGEIAAPLIWGPLSEIYGRRPILNLSNFFFVAFSIGASFSTNIHMLIAFRFLGGTATAIVPIGPGIVRDLFAEEHRGRVMSIMSMAGAIGPVIGPIIGSYLGQDAGWRWPFWLTTIIHGSLSVLFLLFYRETYKVSILGKKVKQERAKTTTGNPNLRSKYDETGEDTVSWKLYKTAIRPIYLLARSPVLMLIALYISIIYGYTYLVMTIIAPVFQDLYGFSEGASGLAFLGLCLGIVCGGFFCSFFLDRYVRLAKRRSGAITPEQRLPPVVIACLIMPSGFFLFGWSTQYHVHFIVPIIGTAVIAFGMAAISISLQNYIIDAFGIYAVSAVSGMLVPRNATGAFLPLAGPPLFRALGYGWGSSVLGFIALAFVPMPLLFMKFGERIRKRSAHLSID